MSLSGDFNPTTRTGHVIVATYTEVDSGYTSLRLRVAVDESRIHWVHNPGVAIHNQTFRDMLPSTSGKTITLTVGQTRYDTFTFTTPSPINPDSAEIVAFIQSDRTTPSPTKRILQGTKISVRQLQYELNPFALISPPDRDTIGTCNPQLIWHSTIDPDSGFDVRYIAEISSDSTFEGSVILSDTLSDTTWTCPQCLLGDIPFYWRVLATNGHAPDRYSTQKFRFIVHEYALSDFGLISPVDSDTVPVCDPTFIWHPSRDADSGFAINYILQLSADPTFEEIPVNDTLPDTSLVYPGCLLGDIPYFWRILAINGHAPDRYSTETFSFVVHEPSGCVYMPGDINNNHSVNGVDIVFGVSYLKGGNPPPIDCSPVCPLAPNPFYAAGDVNGNCAFNGIDITYFVRYLKLQVPQVLTCPDCPPAPALLKRPTTKITDILH